MPGPRLEWTFREFLDGFEELGIPRSSCTGLVLVLLLLLPSLSLPPSYSLVLSLGQLPFRIGEIPEEEPFVRTVPTPSSHPFLLPTFLPLSSPSSLFYTPNEIYKRAVGGGIFCAE